MFWPCSFWFIYRPTLVVLVLNFPIFCVIKVVKAQVTKESKVLKPGYEKPPPPPQKPGDPVTVYLRTMYDRKYDVDIQKVFYVSQ